MQAFLAYTAVFMVGGFAGTIFGVALHASIRKMTKEELAKEQDWLSNGTN